MGKIVILLFLLLLSSCEKSNYCSEIIKGKPNNHLINDSDLQTVKSLFELNNLSLNNFLVYQYLLNEDIGYKHVKCYQYVNNLKVFTDEVIFHFDGQNHFYILSGELISGINIKTSPSLSKNDVIKIFLKNVENDSQNNSDLEQIKDGCFLCELGYYDLNTGISYADQNFRLAWKINPEDSEFPVAYINDSDKSLIYYFNGIIID